MPEKLCRISACALVLHLEIPLSSAWLQQCSGSHHHVAYFDFDQRREVEAIKTHCNDHNVSHCFHEKSVRCVVQKLLPCEAPLRVVPIDSEVHSRYESGSSQAAIPQQMHVCLAHKLDCSVDQTSFDNK